MTDTTFTDSVTVIPSSWLNDANRVTYGVASILDLKALAAPTGPIVVSVHSYYAQAAGSEPDGGGGDFLWNSTDVTADNGGTVIAPNAGGTGRWNRLSSGPVNVLHFGAIGTTSGSSITPFTNALAFLNASRGTGAGGVLETGGTLRVPYGEYHLENANIQVPKDIRIIGELGFRGSAEDVDKGSVIIGGATLPTFVLKNANQIEGLCFAIYSGAGGGTHILIQDQVSGDDQAGSIGIEKCTFQGGHPQVQIIGFGSVNIVENEFGEWNGTAIRIGGGTLTNFAISEVRILRNKFNASPSGITLANRIVDFSGAGNGVIGFSAKSNWINNLKQANAVAFDFSGAAAGTMKSISFEDNLIDLSSANGQTGIKIGTSDTVKIKGNWFNGNGVGTTGIQLTGSTNYAIGPNSFAGVATKHNIDATSTGLLFDAAQQGLYITTANPVLYLGAASDIIFGRNNGGAAVGIGAGFDWQVDTAHNWTPTTDGARDLGNPTTRLKDIHLTGSVWVSAPNTQTGPTYAVVGTDSTVIANHAGTLTVTLPAAASYTGRKLRFVTIQAQLVVSDASNVVPLAGGAAGTAILTNAAGKWADLESDGSNWIITAGN